MMYKMHNAQFEKQNSLFVPENLSECFYQNESDLHLPQKFP